ncbi:MAG: alginate lyase family protein, partial [Bacteroidota bacterium]
LTGKQEYAKKAAELIRVWFLDETTRMNPNLNHAQCRLGHNNGSKSGVLDGRLMIRALEGSLLIKGSFELSEKEYKALKIWAKAYFEWLTTNELAVQEAASKNNHGCYYDAQAIYFALYSENFEAAKHIANNFIENRILYQIKTDGSMPKEVARTRPLFYSIYNLHAMFIVAHLAEKVDVNIWQFDERNPRLRAGLDYLVPYVDQEKLWPKPTIGEVNRMELFPILHMANQVYPEGNYLDFAKKLPFEKRKIHRSNIAFPLMR